MQRSLHTAKHTAEANSEQWIDSRRRLRLLRVRRHAHTHGLLGEANLLARDAADVQADRTRLTVLHTHTQRKESERCTPHDMIAERCQLACI
jgi:hypothetical protein